MARIIVCEPMDADAVARLARRHRVTYDPALGEDEARLRQALSAAEALVVRNRTRVDAALLGAAPHLRVVGRLGVGLDNIDLAACRARAIRVITARGANAQAVAEYVIGAALLLLRGVFGASARVAAGEWPREALAGGRELAGKTLGVLGLGSIGSRTARLARAFGAHTLAHDPAHAEGSTYEDTRLVGLEALLEATDVLSVHVPLDASTRGLLSGGRLASMRRGSILINTARGGIVDEPALARLLADGHLAGAAVDVYAEEPPGADSALAHAPNLLLTPHVAGLSAEAHQRVGAQIANAVDDFLATPGTSDASSAPR